MPDLPPLAADMHYADDPSAVAACFPLMRELRPHLRDADELVERWRRQTAESYRLLVLAREGRPVALAGFRFQENLVYGRHLYVDDLVTTAAERGRRHGERLIARLADEGRAAGCARLVLDTPLDNVLGHRFYYRNGLLARGLRFGLPLA